MIEKFNQQLEKILKGSHGRLLTLTVIAEKDDWQLCSDVYKKLRNEHKQWTNYFFELGGQYPEIVEMSSDKKSIRIRSERLPKVKEALNLK